MGIWKNYDELEDNMSVDELLSTINAARKAEQDRQRFLAAIQGIDLSDTEPLDIADLSGTDAAIAGFGVGMGLGHSVQGVPSP